ncbi:NmrA family protein [Histoplasma ohiense]|nr:NmrA family protein [Histoplasma ohiense (nom. inval.)]
MASPKIVAVFGATGNQGGSVAKSLLGNKGSFQVRGITRNPESERSKALVDLGAEVVKADGFNPAEMVEAFRGAWGAFVNINSDDKIFTDPTAPTEFDLGKIIIDSAVEAGVQHIVFSSGPACTELTGGRVQMNAMNMKNKIEKYIRSIGKFSSAAFICAGWYLENFLAKEVAPIFGGFPHFPDPEGFLTFRVPMWGGKEDVPWLSMTDDYGDIIQGLFLEPEKWNGHVVHGVSDIRSFSELVGAFQQVTGKQSRFDPLLPSWEAFDTHGIHELQDVKLMFAFTQITGGRYFGEKATESDTAAQLKAAGARARGQDGQEIQLITAEEWFKRRFTAQGAST